MAPATGSAGHRGGREGEGQGRSVQNWPLCQKRVDTLFERAWTWSAGQDDSPSTGEKPPGLLFSVDEQL